jgi:MOSC domain-containing protein YiiM
VNTPNIAELIQTFPHTGELIWIGLRPARKAPMLTVNEAMADQRFGLIGDRYNGSSGKRQVTLIQWEHLAVLESFIGKMISPGLGINLLALKNQKFCIGNAVFQTTGLCHPCSRMEEVLGPGGYNALRGHGGLTAQVLTGGLIRVGNSLIVLTDEEAR